MSCSVKGCSTFRRLEANENISFHRFPREPESLRHSWVVATGLDPTSFKWSKNKSICSKHFRHEDYYLPSRLKSNTVPTLCLPIDLKKTSYLPEDSLDSSVPSTSDVSTQKKRNVDQSKIEVIELDDDDDVIKLEEVDPLRISEKETTVSINTEGVRAKYPRSDNSGNPKADERQEALKQLQIINPIMAKQLQTALAVQQKFQTTAAAGNGKQHYHIKLAPSPAAATINGEPVRIVKTAEGVKILKQVPSRGLQAVTKQIISGEKINSGSNKDATPQETPEVITLDIVDSEGEGREEEDRREKESQLGESTDENCLTNIDPKNYGYIREPTLGSNKDATPQETPEVITLDIVDSEGEGREEEDRREKESQLGECTDENCLTNIDPKNYGYIREPTLENPDLFYLKQFFRIPDPTEEALGKIHLLGKMEQSTAKFLNKLPPEVVKNCDLKMMMKPSLRKSANASAIKEAHLEDFDCVPTVFSIMRGYVEKNAAAMKLHEKKLNELMSQREEFQKKIEQLKKHENIFKRKRKKMYGDTDAEKPAKKIKSGDNTNENQETVAEFNEKMGSIVQNSPEDISEDRNVANAPNEDKNDAAAISEDKNDTSAISEDENDTNAISEDKNEENEDIVFISYVDEEINTVDAVVLDGTKDCEETILEESEDLNCTGETEDIDLALESRKAIEALAGELDSIR